MESSPEDIHRILKQVMSRGLHLPSQNNPVSTPITPIVVQRSNSDHRQQHIRPIREIKTFYQGSESERIFSIF